MVGKSYYTQLEPSGGTGPYRWATVGGALPPGLLLNQMGTISGKPKNDGTFRFAVQVTDANDNKSGEQELILTVSPKLRITSDVSRRQDLPAPGSDFIADLHVEGGSPPYKWKAEPESSLPGEINLDDTGRITWTASPVNLRTKRFRVKCTDQDGSAYGYVDTATFFIKACPPWRPWRRRGSAGNLQIAGLSVTVRPSWRSLLFHTSNYLFLLGIGLPAFGAALILFYAVATPGSTLSYLGVGLLTAFAAFLIGGLGGFLFGIPKMVSSGQARQTVGPQYAPSSNLAEVSDWLTKLLLGAGLVQLTHLGAPVGSLIDHIARGLSMHPESVAAAQVMAGTILFSYTAVGLLDGYVITTTWYQSWIVRHAG